MSDAENEPALDLVSRLVPATLKGLHALEFAGRHVSPTALPQLIDAMRGRDDEVKVALAEAAGDTGDEVDIDRKLLTAVEALDESNPMLGLRGVRLGLVTPGLFALQVRAIGEAAPLILVGAITGRLANESSLLDPGQLTERFTAMPIVITRWATYPDRGFVALTAAAIAVLLVFVLLMNTAAILLRNRFERKRQGR